MVVRGPRRRLPSTTRFRPHPWRLCSGSATGAAAMEQGALGSCGCESFSEATASSSLHAGGESCSRSVKVSMSSFRKSSWTPPHCKSEGSHLFLSGGGSLHGIL